MASGATQSDLTVSAQTVREPYATGFLYTQEVGEDPGQIAEQTFEYVAAESDPLSLGVADDGYEAAYASAETSRDTHIDVRYPGKAYAVAESFRHISEPRVVGSATGAPVAGVNTDSTYNPSVTAPSVGAVTGVDPDGYTADVTRPVLVSGAAGDGSHLIDPLSAFTFAGGSDPRERAGGITEASILGDLAAGDSAVPFARVIGRAAAQSAQTAAYTHAFVDPFSRLGFFSEHLGVFSPVAPIGEVSTGTARRVFGGTARINATVRADGIRREFYTGEVLSADATSVSSRTVDDYRLDAAVAALLDTSNTIPSMPQAFTPGVAASREIGEDAYVAGRHLGSALDTDVPSREYEIGLAVAVTAETDSLKTTYAFAQAIGTGIDLAPGHDVYRGYVLEPEAYAIVTVTDDTYVLAYEEGEVYALLMALPTLSGGYGGGGLWVRQGVKVGEKVVWTGKGDPGGLSL